MNQLIKIKEKYSDRTKIVFFANEFLYAQPIGYGLGTSLVLKSAAQNIFLDIDVDDFMKQFKEQTEGNTDGTDTGTTSGSSDTTGSNGDDRGVELSTPTL